MRTAASEWVSLGHPDKLADYITSHILDRIIDADPGARYAVEVLVKDSAVILAGEVTTRSYLTHEDYARWAAEAVRDVGYTAEYQRLWGASNAISADALDVRCFIRGQSTDIARGVGVGWGDQGIFWGMAVADPAHDYLPADYWYARDIGRRLFKSGIGGLDIKTLVSTDGDTPYRVVAAVPLLSAEAEQTVCDLIRRAAGQSVEIVLNGTGRFACHGPVGDSGVTGRKLAVDFYGGNCRVGGGSPWGKDPTKADVTLNLLARRLALAEIQRGTTPTCFCSIACAIGQPDLEIALYDEQMRQIRYWRDASPASEVINFLDLRRPEYARRCREGLFTGV